MSKTIPPSKRTPILGCIADDVTGATDLAINLVQGGMQVVQLLQVPTVEELKAIDADAIVVALKIRSVDKEDAVGQSLAAAFAMQTFGIQRFFFKYCSTFDSTEKGNIGPVAAALLDEITEGGQTIFCPAFPRNGRTVYQGHLFVDDKLLSESGMERHPLNPMTDPNLVRFLGRQTNWKIGLLPYGNVTTARIGETLAMLQQSGRRLVVVDACDDHHLKVIADSVSGMPLVTGGSGVARYLPDSYRSVGLLRSRRHVPTMPTVSGRSLIVSGSCSRTTKQQVEFMRTKCPSWEVDVDAIMKDQQSTIKTLADWGAGLSEEQPALIYSTTEPNLVASIQQRYGVQEAAAAIEQFLADVTELFVSELGVSRLILAGGETSGAIIHRLGVESLGIGPEICAGVPWTESLGERPLALALKSGNFGETDFFQAALEMLP